MLSSIVLLSTIVASALANNSSASYTFPAGFNIGLVKPDELSMSIPIALTGITYEFLF